MQASLLCGSFHVPSNHHAGWMPCHIWSRQITYLLCGSFHVSSNHHSDWMLCHNWSRQMASHLCGSFHVSSNWQSEWITCHIWSMQMALLLCGSFHVSSNWYCWITVFRGWFYVQTTVYFASVGSSGFLVKLKVLLNALSNLEQVNGFSPVWVILWTFKLPLSLNALSHLEKASLLCVTFHVSSNDHC